MDYTLSRDLYVNDYSKKIQSNEVILTIEHQTIKPSAIHAKTTKASLKIIADHINSNLHKNTISQEENPSFRQNFYNNITAINQKIEHHNQRIQKSLLVKILKIISWIFCCRRFKEAHLDRIHTIRYSPEPLKVTEPSRAIEKPLNGDLAVESLEKPSSNRNHQITPCGKIALQLRTGGLLGTEIPKELLEWRTPDDNLIPLDKDALILIFMLYDLVEDVKPLFPSFSFYLPAKLFEDKKEGDVIELKRKVNQEWHLFRFTIDQSSVSSPFLVNSRNKKRRGFKINKHHFEEVLKTSCNQINKDLEAGQLGFSKTLFGKAKKTYEGYTSQNNAKLFVYNPASHEGDQNHMFTPHDISMFREKHPSFSEAKFSFFWQKNSPNWKILFAVSGITHEDRLDIVINEMYFCLYVEKPFNLPPGYKMINQMYSTNNYLTIIPWKNLFEQLDQEQLMDQLSRSKVDLKDGQLTIQYTSE